MPQTITLGTATAQPGTTQYGRWEALSHPTGHVEFLPVIIAQGAAIRDDAALVAPYPPEYFK